MFSPAFNSADFDDSLKNQIFTEVSSEVTDIVQNETSITTEETSSGQNLTLSLLKSHLDDLKQQLEEVQEQLKIGNSIQVVRGLVTQSFIRSIF